MADSDQDKAKTSLREKAAYPVGYMFGVTFLAAAVLIGLVRFTDERVQANRRILFERAVLESVGLASHATPRSEVHRLFVDNMEPPEGDGVRAYRYVKDGSLQAYALPISGQGFWNTISGVIGVEPDGKTVVGISFYEQSETPGLGAEIVKPEFRDQFEGKRLAGQAPYLELRSVGSELDASSVHAITGATQTCTRLEAFLNEALSQWQKLSRLRGGAT